MITCDACGKGQPAGDNGRMVQLHDIALSFAPPPGLSLRPVHLCWGCAARVYNSWVGVAKASIEADLPVKLHEPKSDVRPE